MQNKKVIIALISVLFSIFLYSNSIVFWANDNIFKSYDKEGDFGFIYDYNYLKTNINNEIEFNGELYLPLINYSLFQSYLNVDYYTYMIDTYSDILANVFYCDMYLYFADYFESNVISPGYYIYYKHYFENSMIKLSNDIYPKIYPFISDINNIQAKQLYKYLLYYRGINFQFNIYSGDKYFYKELKNVYYFAVKPLISFNIKNKIGFAFSYLYKKTYSDTLPYYYDDSYTDEFYYSNRDFELLVSGKNDNKRLELKYIYSNRNFINTKDIEYIDYYSIYGITFSNVNRKDKNHLFSIQYEIVKNKYNMGVKYEYEKNTSTNAFYNYSEHNFSITYKY